MIRMPSLYFTVVLFFPVFMKRWFIEIYVLPLYKKTIITTKKVSLRDSPSKKEIFKITYHMGVETTYN